MSGCRIWEYPLTITDEQTLCLPRGRVLSVAEQSGRAFDRHVMMWILLKPASLNADVRDSKLHVRVIGTGNPCPDMDGWDFAGTVLTSIGLVWHVFCRWED